MDVRGYWVMPNGSSGVQTLAGTEERGFQRPPDLGAAGWMMLMGGRSPLETRSGSDVGTNERQFHRPPDLGSRMVRVEHQMEFDLAGTETQGFQTPPDGRGGGVGSGARH